MKWVITKTTCDGIGNVMKGFLSALSINPQTTIECAPEYSLGHYDTVLDPRHIYTGGPREPFYTCRLLVLQSEEEDQQTIENEFSYTNGCGNPALNHHFSFTRLIDWNYDPSKICDRVKTRILAAIDQVRFQPQILRRVEELRAQIRPGHVLGVSVRTWTAPHEHNIRRPYSFDAYMDAIRPHLATVSTIVLSVDNDAVLPQYLEALAPANVLVLRKGEGENETQHAFIKMLTLASCDAFIGARISTFSELVFWFSRCRIQVTPLF
jgi:hypothetical protein